MLDVQLAETMQTKQGFIAYLESLKSCELEEIKTMFEAVEMYEHCQIIKDKIDDKQRN